MTSVTSLNFGVFHVLKLRVMSESDELWWSEPTRFYCLPTPIMEVSFTNFA